MRAKIRENRRNRHDKLISKIINITVIVCMLAGLAGMSEDEPYTAYGAVSPPPEISAETAVLMDARTGTVLYNKNMHRVLEPASTTKIMTGILAVENLKLNRIAIIDGYTPFTEGSRIYLEEGERISVDELLYAMFLDSANDAATALAKEVSGSVESFAKLMNSRAAELGAKNTHFINPNGLHLEGHTTSAYDLSLMAKEALTKPEIRKYITTYLHTIPATNKQPERYLHNTNRLLYDTKFKVTVDGVPRPAKYEYVTGMKTGYTSHAGACLVASAKKGDTELISVVMKTSDTGRYQDSISLLEWGFANYRTVCLAQKGNHLGNVKVEKGLEKQVAMVVKNDVYTTLPMDSDEEKLAKKQVLSRSKKNGTAGRDKKGESFVGAPVFKGETIETMSYYDGEFQVGEVELIARSGVEAGGVIYRAWYRTLGKTGLGIGLTISVFLVTAATGVLMVVRHINKKKARERRKARAMQIAMERELERLQQNRRRYMDRY